MRGQNVQNFKIGPYTSSEVTSGSCCLYSTITFGMWTTRLYCNGLDHAP